MNSSCCAANIPMLPIRTADSFSLTNIRLILFGMPIGEQKYSFRKLVLYLMNSRFLGYWYPLESFPKFSSRTKLSILNIQCQVVMFRMIATKHLEAKWHSRIKDSTQTCIPILSRLMYEIMPSETRKGISRRSSFQIIRRIPMPLNCCSAFWSIVGMDTVVDTIASVGLIFIDTSTSIIVG